MKTITILLSCWLVAVAGFSQTSLQGSVKDVFSGEPIIFGSVALFQKGVLITGTETDLDGFYSFTEIDTGTYDVLFTYTGYSELKIEGVIVNAGKANRLDAKMSAGVTLEEVVVCYKRPVIKKNSTTMGKSITSEEIRKLPKREVKTIRKMSAGVSEGDDITIRGSRSTDYYIDGVRVSADKVETIPGISAGTLTAGEIHDFSKWDLWQDIAAEDLAKWRDHWKFQPVERYTVQVMTEQGQPVVDAVVNLLGNDETVWTARTDNTGRAELWAHAFDPKKKEENPFRIEVLYQGETHTLQQARLFQDGVNTLKINTLCQLPSLVDVLFVVDATSSMNDEIAYLKAELNDVIQQAQDKLPGLQLNLGSVFYRDTRDEYVTRKSPFSTNISKTTDFIRFQNSGGGGDAPEAVDSALTVAIQEMEWSTDARARLLFLVLDAPPHSETAVIAHMHRLSQEAAGLGIRIIPVTGSGIDKSAEYLMRCLALATNGTYVFLTDHSGVGGRHIEPTSDAYQVEKLNDLLVRLMLQYSQTPDCEQAVALVPDKPGGYQSGSRQNRNALKAFPNPTGGALTVELKKPAPDMYVTDQAGKILQRYKAVKKGKTELNLGNLPNGSYFIKTAGGEEPLSVQVVVAH